MPIPDFQSIMLPLLKYFSDRKEHSTKEVIDHLGKYFGLTDEELSLQLPSGKQYVFYNRVHWAIAHLNIAKLLINTKRAHYQISDNGLSLLNSNPPLINLKLLKSIPEYAEHVKSYKKEKNDKKEIETEFETDESITPLESLEYAYQKLKKSLAQELLNKVKSMPASFFEKLVIELLVKMGYGGSIKDAGKAVGKSGDEGIDGIIKEDKLGLDIVYIQAKRWEGTVGRPEIQKFVGALAGHGAKKGIFITTSYFSKEALDYTPKNETKIVLIDGEQLAQYMIDYDLGVSTVSNYQIKKIDLDYFGED